MWASNDTLCFSLSPGVNGIVGIEAGGDLSGPDTRVCDLSCR
jgi:hypothetical protein